MDAGETFCFQGKEEAQKEVKLLTLACRFVPYDQWLVTHVDSSWTINQVKAWILAKCIANNSSGNAPAQSPLLPPINPPPKPKTKPARRPASPIIFAAFSPSDTPHSPDDGPVKEEKSKGKKRRGRGRPISPITFAPIGVVDPKNGSDGEDFSKSPDVEGEVIGMGYEEDDEWDSEEDTDMDDIELELDSKLGRRANRNQYMGYHDRLSRPSADQHNALPAPSRTTLASKTTLINPASLPRGSFTTYHPNLLTLIRFSTGQILEKHFTILDYEMKPYELIEIHRLGVVTKLPREITFQYIEPYWEGWVKALRVVFREPRVVAEARLQAREETSRRKDYHAPDMKNSAAESAHRTMEVLAGGPVKVGPFPPADVALGLGLRPAAPSRTKSARKIRRSVGNEQELFGLIGKPTNNQNGAPLERSGTASSKHSATSSRNTGGSSNHSRSKGKLEWRERWLFIKDGVLHLKKENSDLSSTITQSLPLSSLTEVRGIDQLGRTMASMPQSPSQRIVCAKFKTRMTTTKPSAPESSHHMSSHTRNASQANILTNANVMSSSTKFVPKSTNSSSKPSKGSTTFSKPSSSTSKGTMSHPGNGSISSFFPIGSSPKASSSSGYGQNRPISPLAPSKPKIMLQINPLPSSSRVVSAKERSSSLDVLGKGKGKAPAKYSPRFASATGRIESEVPSGPPSEAASEIPSEAPTDEEGAASDDEADAADFDKKKKRQKQAIVPPQQRAVNERRHPTIAMDSDADDGSGGSLSSPVFAHSDDDSPFSDGPGIRSYGYGYRNFGGTSELRRRREGKEVGAQGGGAGREGDGEANPDADTSYVLVSGGDDNAAEVSTLKGKVRRPSSARSRHSNREKVDPDSEWIVLDLGDDFAFKSFLRVIHRHAPHAVDSSFLSTLPTFQMPKTSSDPVPTAPAPTPNFAPSPNQATPSVSFGQWSWNTARHEQDRRPITEEISPITPVDKLSKDSGPSSPLLSETAAEPQSVCGSVTDTPAGTQTPVSPDAPRDSKQYRLPPSPTYSRLLGVPYSGLLGRKQPEKKVNIQSSLQKNSIGTFGALPYPEWRLEVVTKAQRAGMGDLTRAMDQFLWSDNPGLALLTRELGLSLAPMELIRSPSIHTAGDRYSFDGGEESTEDVASMRRQKRRRERKMTLERENIAMGLEIAGVASNGTGSIGSSPTLIDSNRQNTQQQVPSISNGPEEPSPTSPFHAIRVHTETSISSSLKLGYVDMDSSESGEESSDAEWLGWMADLHRQAKIQREEDERRDRLETASVVSSTDTYHYWDYQQQDDHRRYQEERKALEPSAIVTSSPPYTSPNSPTVAEMSQLGHQHHTSSTSTHSGSSLSHAFGSNSTTASLTSQMPLTPSGDKAVGRTSVLTSPSSNESLGNMHGRRLSFGLSPSEPPSSATSPSLSQVGHTAIEVSYQENEHSPIRNPRGIHTRGGPHLSHYASTGLISLGTLESAREMEFHGSNLTNARRPSMPTLSSSSSDLSTPPPMQSFSSAGTGSSWWPADAHSTASNGVRSSSPSSSSHPAPATIPRRSSANGLATNSSLGRSSSLLGKGPALLRKRTTTREAEDERDKDIRQSKGKQKEKLSKGKEKERSPDAIVQETSGEGKSRRPRLSLSMSNQAYNQASNSEAVSPSATAPAFKGRIIRHIKSSQSLLSGEEGSTSARNNPPAKKKKKKGFEKLIQSFESTLDFVDAR